MEKDKELELYKQSRFYEKYKETQVSDKILKEVFDVKLSSHRLFGLRTYSQVHKHNVEVMNDFINLFSKGSGINDEDLLRRMIDAVYLDPDGYAIKLIGEISCSADGLLSIKRICRKYGVSEKTIHEYEHYRRKPIFFFPQEKNGINMTRASVFSDKIDHTLFDLKRRFDGKECRLSNAYNLPRTSKWMLKVGPFENLVEIYDIKGIFVNDDYEVFDLEKSDGSIITEYRSKYSREWSNSYYDNLKKKIDEFMNK